MRAFCACCARGKAIGGGGASDKDNAAPAEREKRAHRRGAAPRRRRRRQRRPSACRIAANFGEFHQAHRSDRLQPPDKPAKAR